MPRRTTGVDEPRRVGGDLADRLAEELRAGRESGQPLIYERAFPTGKLRVSVLWDDWDRLPPEDRTEVILRAYEQAEGPAARGRVALASGLTFPEAHAAGMLPVRVIPALRSGDPVTAEQCRDALVAEGASTLLDPDRPELRFATEAEAEAARGRLTDRLPGSAAVWTILRDPGMVDEWPHR